MNTISATIDSSPPRVVSMERSSCRKIHEKWRNPAVREIWAHIFRNVMRKNVLKIQDFEHTTHFEIQKFQLEISHPHKNVSYNAKL